MSFECYVVDNDIMIIRCIRLTVLLHNTNSDFTHLLALLYATSKWFREKLTRIVKLLHLKVSSR